MNGQQVTAQLVYTTREVTEELPLVVTHATFLIDASGSMVTRTGGAGSCSRFDLVMQYMKKLMQDVLLPTDLLTVAFFNSTYKRVSAESYHLFGCFKMSASEDRSILNFISWVFGMDVELDV